MFLQTREIYSLTVVRAEVQNQGIISVDSFWRLWGRWLCQGFTWLQVAAAVLGYSCPTPMTASSSYLPLFCVFTRLSSKNTSLNWGPTIVHCELIFIELVRTAKTPIPKKETFEGSRWTRVLGQHYSACTPSFALSFLLTSLHLDGAWWGGGEGSLAVLGSRDLRAQSRGSPYHSQALWQHATVIPGWNSLAHSSQAVWLWVIGR